MNYHTCFHLLSVLSIQCFMVCLATTTRNFTTDQSALLEFKHGIADPRNELPNNWTISSSVCNWIGVSCGVKHERVVALNLTNMNLTGTITPHLANLSFLFSLDLSRNNFYGNLPIELGRLHRLRLIRLSFNGLNGEIPSSLGRLRKLNILKFAYNSFTGTIPQTLGNMSNLEILNLSFNLLDGHIPFSILKISTLKMIDFSDNNLSGSLPNDFCVHLPTLELVSLGGNQLSSSIPSSIGECSNLQFLDLHANKFNGVIPRNIGNLTQLKGVYLGINNLEGEIPMEIGNLLSLEKLSITDNKGLTGQIPTSIFNISSLKTIGLSNNSLSGSLPNDICNHLPKLEGVFLSENKLSGNIPSSIDECNNLQILELSINQFSGIIPRSIGNLTQLKELYLGTNKLEGEIPKEIGNLLGLEILSIQHVKGLIGQIPTSIFNISSLKTIDLANNSLSGNLPFSIKTPMLEELLLQRNRLGGNIPNSISNASMLKFVELERNFFSGLIPDSLGNLIHLEWINLAYNNLTTKSVTHEWTFLSSLANCRNLTFISVSRNPLNGSLPSYIGNLSTSLQKFVAQDCGLTGNIPSEIGNLSNLLGLELRYNELSGSIPASIGGLRNLQLLYLSSNKLGGSIPESICGLERVLYTLLLGSNKLHGSIPSCLGNMTSLRFLFLDSNYLSSTIPSTLWNLRDILQLDLSSNYLNTSHAFDVGDLRSLVYLNLSRNMITCDISSTIGGLQTLVTLDLSNNKLYGHIPDSFGGLISLEFLDLSNNNLSSLIPKSLEKLLHLDYFNVSFNRLEGEIPTKGCFSNYSSTSFMKNYALCGPPRLLVPPCNNDAIHENSNKTAVLRALRYGLPTFGIVLVLIVLAIVYRRCRSRSTTLPVKDDLWSFKTRRRISHGELSQATGGFGESNRLGSGSFGCVYKGRLSDGLIVAVKVFNLQVEGAFRSFDTECEAMSNIVHRNLVKVITCCSNLDFKALVLNFMSNGSLDNWLHSENHFLDILQRVDVMIDVATALEHLHIGHPTPVIHCDLKPSNILLDEDMVAHVGDFGISKLLGEGDVMKQTMTLATIGYMAPEFGSTGIVSVKSDVYSYGIVLIETFTKRKPTDEIFGEEMSIRHWMKRSLCKGMIDIADADLLRREDQYFVVKANCISSIMELAFDCSAELPEERKDMKDVVVELKKIKQRFLNTIEHV